MGAPNRTADVGGMTLREIAVRMGISHARVQQLEASALRKLRALHERGAAGLAPHDPRSVCRRCGAVGHNARTCR